MGPSTRGLHCLSRVRPLRAAPPKALPPLAQEALRGPGRPTCASDVRLQVTAQRPLRGGHPPQPAALLPPSPQRPAGLM